MEVISVSRLALVSVLMTALSASAISNVQAQRYVDPRVSMSGYRAWCAQQGGTVDLSGGVACRVNPGRSSYSGGAQLGSSAGQALGQAMAPLFYQFGQQIGCMLIGGCTDQRAVQEAQRRAAEIEAERVAAEAERLRKEEEASRKFQQAQERMLGELRGYDFDGPQLRGFEAPPLQVEPTRGLLGAADLKPRELTTPSSLSTRGRVRCAVSLLYKANKAYVDINTQAALWEAAYLSNEAANIASAASHRPNVECPPEPPSVGAAVETREAQLQLMRIQQSAILFARVQQQIADVETQKTSIQNSEAKLKDAENQIAESRKRIDQLQQQHVAPPPIAGTQTDRQQQQKDDSALAEAMAALQQAESALQSTREVLKVQQGEFTQMQKDLNGSMKQLQGTMRSWSSFDLPSEPRS